MHDSCWHKEQLPGFEAVSAISIYKPACAGDDHVDFVAGMGCLMIDFVGLVDFDDERAVLQKGEEWFGGVGECLQCFFCS